MDSVYSDLEQANKRIVALEASLVARVHLIQVQPGDLIVMNFPELALSHAEAARTRDLVRAAVPASTEVLVLSGTPVNLAGMRPIAAEEGPG